MNKKIFLIVFITILFLVVLLISVPKVVQSKMNNRILVEQPLSKDEFNAKRQKEKEEWTNSQKSNDTLYYSTENIQEDTQLIEEYSKTEEEELKKASKREEIMNRFYKGEYKSLSDKILENSDKMSINELYLQPYTEEFFRLIIDVMKNKDITNEEKDILKEYLIQQYDWMFNDSKIKLEIEEVLNNN